MNQNNQKGLRRTILNLGYGIDYPLDAAMDVPSLRIVDRSIVIVEGCKGLIDYRNDRITIDLGNYAVSVFGKELVMETLTKGSMNVIGKIMSVCFDLPGSVR